MWASRVSVGLCTVKNYKHLGGTKISRLAKTDSIFLLDVFIKKSAFWQALNVYHFDRSMCCPIGSTIPKLGLRVYNWNQSLFVWNSPKCTIFSLTSSWSYWLITFDLLDSLKLSTVGENCFPMLCCPEMFSPFLIKSFIKSVPPFLTIQEHHLEVTF